MATGDTMANPTSPKQNASLRRSPKHAVPIRSIGLVSLLALVFFVGTVSPATAQRQVQSRKVLKDVYFAAHRPLHEGDYREAQKGFKRSLSKAMKTTDARWIDSICYYAMAGETAFQLGRNAEALEHFSAALRLAVQYHDWMLYVDFGLLQPEAGARQQPTWGRSKRAFRLARFPDTTSIERTQLGVAAVNGQAGITKQSTYVQLHVDELVRCTALAMRRRMELLGPASARDKLTSSVLAKFSLRPGPPNHWSSAWIDLQHGLALLAAGRDRQAIPILKRSIVAGGEFDHPLTCVSLLELGKLSFNQGDYANAGGLFLEASLSAFYFRNWLVVEEALRYGTLTHIVTGQKNPYAPLEQALNWARSKRLHVLEASLAVLAAEHAVQTNNDRAIKNTLQRAARAVGKERIATSRLGAKYKFVEALAASRDGDQRRAESALQAAMDYMNNSSVRLFQITLANHAYTKNQTGARASRELFAEVLVDPAPVRWRHEPLEALAVVTYRNFDAINNWFNLAVEAGENRDNLSEAIEVADRARRWRFCQSLPLGGRILGLRWVLDAPAESLSEAAMLQRNDITGRYPKLVKLQEKSASILGQLKKLPVAPEDSKEEQQQKKLLESLAKVSQALEAEMRHVALRREPIDMAFPPPLDFEAMIEKLGPKEAVLAFYENGRAWHAFLIMKKGHTHWKIASPRDVKKHLTTLHRSLGNTGPASQLDYEFLNGDKWNKSATRLTDAIMKDSRVSLDEGIDDITIVPDGLLWYVPFELLQLGSENGKQSLVSIAKIRYAPTISLAVPNEGARRRGGATAIVAGKILSKDDDEQTNRSAAELARLLPRSEILRERPAKPSNMLAKTIDSLVVLAAIEPAENPFEIAPWQVDRGRAGSQLSGWLSAPLAAPELVLWPGFRTPAESALKGMGKIRPGNDMFLSICGMMASGSRSMLVSRWRTGGQTCHDLMREYLQELPHSGAADAWQRCIQVAMETPLGSTFEPRVRENREDREINASHPFFWSGYIVIDNTAMHTNENAEEPGGDKKEQRPKIEFPGAAANN